MSLRLLLYSVTNPGEAGGVQAVIRRLASHLRGRGHAVVTAWLTPSPDPAESAHALPRLRKRWGIPTPRSTLRALGALLALRRALAHHRPHVVNVHYVTCEAIYFLLLRPICGYKLVFSVHGSDVLRPTRWDQRLLPGFLHRADAITAVSGPTVERVRAFPGVDAKRLRLILNGIDFDFWNQALPEARPLDQRPMTVLAVGRLLPVKGHDVLLRAFAQVRQRVPAARLVLIGDGASRESLQQLANELGVADSVEFAGEMDAASVRARLAEARLFVLPSRSEGLPLALLEAMAAGVPCVATRVGGVPDVLTPGSGVLVPPEDPPALAEPIVQLLLDPPRATDLAQQGVERAKGFSAATTAADYEALFHELTRA